MNVPDIWLTSLLIVFLLGWSPRGNASELTIRLDNPPSTGTVVFVLFDSPNAFSNLRDPAKVVKIALDGRAIYRIENLPPDEFALLAYFDENNNDRIDKNFIGIPKEPLGFSNGYFPKGPPSYSRAAFVLSEGESRHFDIKLNRPLGKHGRLGAGLGIIARSSPYREYSGGVYQVLPAVTYNGERLQIFGPNFQVGLFGSGKLRLAASGTYRIGVYEEDESDFLAGMGDRKDTFMAGLSLQTELPGGVDLFVNYAHDIFDEIGGGEGHVKFEKLLQIGALSISPGIGLNWLSSRFANNDFGVSPSKATADRPAYSPDAAISVEGGMGIFIEINRDWLVVVNMSAEFLDEEVTDSSIVSENYVIKSFSAINYVF